MKIDLRKLYGLGKLEIKENIVIPEEYYKNMNVLSMDKVVVDGVVTINYEDNIELDLVVNGKFIMPCSITFEELEVPFSTRIKTEILENTLKNEFYLDLLYILWENIVLEVPFNVVKEGAEIKNLRGEGWELSKEE